MHKLISVLGSVVLCGLLVCQSAQGAALVEVEVRIKSVDLQSRQITVAYKTTSGPKTIDLDVSRKAEITINGDSGTLESVRPGQKAKTSYDKELLVVTKINATGNGTAPGQEVYRITLQLSEFGDGKFRIEKTSQAPADDFEGTPFKLSRWPKTKATKGQDGMFRLVHDFSDADDLNVLSLFPPTNAAIDKEAGLLVFRSGPLQGTDVTTGATIDYGKKIRLPLTLIFDIVEHGDAGFAIQVSDGNGKLGCLQCRLAAQTHDLEQPFEVIVGWHELGEGGKKNATSLCDKKEVTLDEPFEKSFRLPLPNAKITEPMLLRFARMFGEKTTKVSRFEVRGRLAPMFGMGVDEKSGTVFAKNVAPNGLSPARPSRRIGCISQEHRRLSRNLTHRATSRV